jgi:hypothetical protein
MPRKNTTKAGAQENPLQTTNAERLALAYAQVFGADETKRNEAQKLVWQDMERRGYFLRSTAVPSVAGEVQPVRMEIAEGMRIFFLDILSMVNRAKSLGEPKQKPITIK